MTRRGIGVDKVWATEWLRWALHASCVTFTLALAAAAACGGSTTFKNGGETHWLRTCTQSAECRSGLECLCGVCTAACTNNVECGSIDANAVCAPAADTGLASACGSGAPQSLCVRQSQLSGAGGNGGTSADGGAGATCSAQDARPVGTGSCEQYLGHRWDGEACELLVACECEGADCGNLSASLEDCAAEHAPCFDNQSCTDERDRIRDQLLANKSCTDTSDCRSHTVSCGLSEDGCTGTVYSNNDLDPSAIAELTVRLVTCTAAFEDSDTCAICERVPVSPSCVDGRCIGIEPCALEQGALHEFLDANKTCQSVDDCAVQSVGCGVTEDDCTGAVYLSEGFDADRFDHLRSQLFTCADQSGLSCSACERLETPAACVDGRCQRGQF